jgi:predicted ArsR family transcriptional regulator
VASEYLRRARKLYELSPLARQVFDELESLGPMSASDERVLRRIGASRPAIDRGMRELERAGLARSYFEINGPGRPRRLYEINAAGPADE